MPRVNTAVARKDYPSDGIKKGDTYYYWDFRYGGKRRSLTPPKPSQLTQSKMSAALAAGEELDAAIGSASCPEDISNAMQEAIDAIQEVADEYREVGDAEPRPPSADECEEKADNLESWISDIETAKDEVEGMDASDYHEEDTLNEQGEKYEVKEFDDLNDEEKEAFMTDARETASGVTDCPC